MLWLKTEVAIGVLSFFICYTGSDPRARRRSSRRRSGCIPRPCVVGSWSEWSACGTKCKVQTTTRKEIISAKCGGPCPTLEQWRWCGRMTCFNGGRLEDERCVCEKGYSGYCCEEKGCGTDCIIGIVFGAIFGCLFCSICGYVCHKKCG